MMLLKCKNEKCGKEFEVYKTVVGFNSDGEKVIKERCGNCSGHLEDITDRTGKGLCSSFKQKEGSASDYSGY